MNTYLFFHKEGSYTLELRNDQEAKFKAEQTETTVRVQTLEGRVVWADNNRMN